MLENVYILLLFVIANYQRNELISELIHSWSELNKVYIHTTKFIFSELNVLMGKEKNTYKTKMVGKTLTLLELYLLKKPQRENMKNNKLLFYT